MKKHILASAIIAGGLGLCAPILAVSSTVASNKVDTLQYLYVQSAKSAVLEPIDGKDQKVFKLTLKEVHPYVTSFSDRPHRITDKIHTKQFIAEWLHPKHNTKNNFNQDPPNADLNAITKTGEHVNIPLELTNPRYNHQAKTFTYTVTSLHGGQSLSAMQLLHPTLVIDDYCTNCPP